MTSASCIPVVARLSFPPRVHSANRAQTNKTNGDAICGNSSLRCLRCLSDYQASTRCCAHFSVCQCHFYVSPPFSSFPIVTPAHTKWLSVSRKYSIQLYFYSPWFHTPKTATFFSVKIQLHLAPKCPDMTMPDFLSMIVLTDEWLARKRPRLVSFLFLECRRVEKSKSCYLIPRGNPKSSHVWARAKKLNFIRAKNCEEKW